MEKINTQETEKLSGRITRIVTSINFGEGISVAQLASKEMIEEIRQSEIKNIDYRSLAEDSKEISSVFDGLEFDPEHLRSQAFVLYNTKEDKRVPVGVMTIIITPKKHLLRGKYWEKTADGLKLLDFKTLADKADLDKFPEFVIEPAWTKVDPKYKGQFAISGFLAIKKIIAELTQEAPDNTCILASAQGKLSTIKNGREAVKRLSEFGLDVGTIVKSEDLPKVRVGEEEISIAEYFGQNSEGSAATVSLAKALDMSKIKGVVSGTGSLGPIYIKKLK